jgi:hypothetical protein
MKICVGTRPSASGREPSRLCLGRCLLPVAAVLDCHEEGGGRVFTVRVLDGRRFAVRLRSDGEWDLVAAYGRAAGRGAPTRLSILPLVALVAVVLWGKMSHRARRAGRAVPVLPGGGATA